jgi:hypothetical protein
MRHPDCMCGETTVDPWCIICCPDSLPGDGEVVGSLLTFQDKPCFYCGEPINNLAGNPAKWSLNFPNDPDQPGVCLPHHVGCVLERLQQIDFMNEDRGYVKNAQRINCNHKYVPSDPKDQVKYQASGAICSLCGDSPAYGWYCPESPDGLCSYDDMNDPIHDGCLHCSQPEERK